MSRCPACLTVAVVAGVVAGGCGPAGSTPPPAEARIIAPAPVTTAEAAPAPAPSPEQPPVATAPVCASPAHRWDVIFGGPSADDTAHALTVDAGGNLYVTGRAGDGVDAGGGARAAAGSTDILLASFGAGGAYRWDALWGGSRDDFPRAVAVDAGGGYVVVTGVFRETADAGGGQRSSHGLGDAFIVGHGPNGAHRWDLTFGTEQEDQGRAVVMDSGGNAYVAGNYGGVLGRSSTLELGGHAYPNRGQEDAFLLSVDPQGAVRWMVTFGGPGRDWVDAIALDPRGNLVVAGFFDGAIDLGGGPRPTRGSYDVFVASFTAGGAHRWDVTFGSPEWDEAHAVTVDRTGNITVVGFFSGTLDLGGGPHRSAGEFDAFVAGLGPDGRRLWEVTFGGTGADAAESAAVDGAGNVVVSGRVTGAVDLGGGRRRGAGGWDAFVASFGPDGAYRWDRTFGSRQYDDAEAVAIDPAGTVLVTGFLSGPADLGAGRRRTNGAGDFFLLALGCAP